MRFERPVRFLTAMWTVAHRAGPSLLRRRGSQSYSRYVKLFFLNIIPHACPEPVLVNTIIIIVGLIKKLVVMMMITRQAEQLERGGVYDLEGPAGTAAFFNLSALHAATVRPCTRGRKSVQVYYCHQEYQSGDKAFSDGKLNFRLRFPFLKNQSALETAGLPRQA